jgi:16S rRNA (guanine1516-N2)-methyltransferase
VSDSLKFQEKNGEIVFEFENREQKVKVVVEFSSRHKIGGKDDLLAKAIALKSITKKTGEPLRVLDLTAGLGRDAFHMAQLGCDVTALERNMTLATALQRAWKNSDREEKLNIVHADAVHYLSGLAVGREPDVIYYDPMFPEKKKSALAGKESQLLQLLAGETSNEAEESQVFELALVKARHRVVVKRPLSAPFIGRKPEVIFKGKAVRFDVYVLP